MRFLLALLAVLSVVGLWVPTAGAASRPLTLSTDGAYPQLAVDSSGNAHIVWTTYSDGTITITYCEIPDHGTRCAITHTFPDDDDLIGVGARVVLGPAAGEVVVLGDTGDFPGSAASDSEGDGIAVWVSMDGGETFTAGAEGGGYTQAVGYGAPRFFLGSKPAFGPGGFSVSMLDDAGDYEDIPINAGPAVGPTAVPANAEDTELFADRCGGYSNTSVAMVNSTTPIAACDAGTPGAPTALEYRIANGQGDIDNASTGSWGAVGTFPIGGLSGDFDNLVGGPRGVFANYESTADSVAVRHLSGASFGPATTIASKARPQDFSQDATGNLYAAYSHDPGQGTLLAASTSADGKTWTTVPIAAPGLTFIPPDAQVGGCAAATKGQSGNGWVVWRQGDQTPPDGTIVAESFGDSPCGGDQGSATCPTQLTVGVARLLATDGCFAKQHDGTYTASGQTELNGMMIDPSGGAGTDARAVNASAGLLSIDTVNHTISSTAPALVKASNIPLVRQTLDWLLPSVQGTITDLADKYAKPVAFDPSSLGGRVLGFAINGLVTPILKPGGIASLAVNAVMPSPIGGFIGKLAPTDDLSLTTSDLVPGGLSLTPGSVHIHIPDVSLGIAELKPFDLDYDSDPSVFDGHIDLLLPVLDNGLDTHFRFEQGQFVEGDADLDLGADFMMFPDVFLQHIDLHVAGRRGNPCTVPAAASDGPTSIGGGMTVALGPLAGSGAVLTVQGNATYTFPEQSCDEPGLFAITGTGKLFGIDVGHAHASFATNGNISLGANLSLGDKTLGLSADVEGDIAARSPFAFYAQGSASVYLGGLAFGPTFVASNIGIGACLSPVGYIEYKWGGSLSGGPGGCDLGDLKPAAFSTSLRRAQATAASAVTSAITVPRHESAEEIVLTGSGGAPRVTLSGPGGAQVSTPALAAGQTGTLTESRAADVAVFGSLDQTAIRLNHPAAGRWTIAGLPGSPAISGVSVAHALPAVAVRARVLPGSGHTRTVAYRSTPAPGRVVTLIETGAGAVAHPLGRFSGARGDIRFTPAGGPAGRRAILAEVTERGVPVGKPLRVASYQAPGPLKLTRPRDVTVTRQGQRIRIAWGGVAGADRYVVRAMLADGRALVLVVPRSRRSVTVGAVSGVDDGTVMVAALDAANHPGPVGTVRLAAVKPTCLRPKARRGKLICASATRTKRHKHR